MWHAPAAYEAAAADLAQMQRMGIRVVRTAPVEDARLLTLADTLGITFYQELPFDYLTPSAFQEALPRMQVALADLLARSYRHSSGRVVGLARRLNTSDPRTCAMLASLATEARARRPDLQVYYVAPFIERDRCAAEVDFVLLPALDQHDPLARLARWERAHPATPAGLVVGWWIDRSARGVGTRHSPEQVAAQLDALLTRLAIDTTAAQTGGPDPVALIVYRWRDGNFADPLAIPTRTQYGLLAEGRIRPAFEVVEGRFTGQRDVFALPRGQPAHRTPADTLRLLAWAVLLFIAVAMKAEPRFRQLAYRYFRAHGFYRESIRDGRDALWVTTLVPAVAFAVCAGLIVAVAVSVLYTHPAAVYVLSIVPPEVQRVMVRLLSQPYLLALFGALFFLIAYVVQALIHALAVRRRHPLGPVQTLALGVWSLWPLLPLAFAALVVQTLDAPWALWGVLAVGVAALAVSLIGLARTLYDLMALTRVPSYVALALCLVHPLVVLALLVGMTAFDYGDSYRFFLELARRGI